MTDLQPLTILLDRNERDRDAALAAHQRALAASAAAAHQAEQLRVYRQEYQQRWHTQFRSSGQIEVVRHYQSFMERLTLAVEQQARVAEHAAQQVAQALVKVRETEMRCAGVRKLIERRLHEHRRDAERRDQKQTDEAASRAAWTRIGATRPSPLM